MPSRIANFFNNAILNTHAGLGKVIKVAKHAAPHLRKGLSTLATISKYIADAQLHPYATLAGRTIQKAASIGTKLIDRYEPVLDKIHGGYPSMAPTITLNGMRLDRPLPLIQGSR